MIRLTEQQINSKIDWVKHYTGASNAASGSTLDANANVTNKNIATMEAEISKDFKIQINRELIRRNIENEFGGDVASQYIKDLESHLIYTHDETSLAPYCVSINMFSFLTDGMGGLGGEATAPKNLDSFCGSFINLIFAVASQFAGAVASVEFLMYFDYFATKEFGEDYLVGNEKRISQYFQQVTYSLNQPAASRGYQCVREDTTQLSTPNGFKYLSELSEGDECYVWVNGEIKTERIQKLNRYNFDGELMQFKGRNYQQTVTPNHRVVYKKHTNEYEIKEAKDVFGHSKLSMPIGSDGIDIEDYGMSDTLTKLCVAFLTEGSIDKKVDGDNFSGRVTFYKSKNRYGHAEIQSWLKELGLAYTTTTKESKFGDVDAFRLDTFNSQTILRQVKHTKKEVPHFFKLLSKRQILMVLDEWSKFDGEHTQMLQCDNDGIRNDLQELAILAGVGSEVYDRQMTKFNSDEECVVKYLKLFKRDNKRISEYNLIEYSGDVWCPTTDAGVVIFREENGIPYVSGNSVFWNISTFDKEFFDGIFSDFVFPDMVRPNWESLDNLQRYWHRWFREERKKALLTFPVVTHACISNEDGTDLKDIDSADFIADEMSKGGEFFIYTSDSADSLASCCFDGDEQVLVKTSSCGVELTTFKEIATRKHKDKKNLTVLHDGSWSNAKTVIIPRECKKMFEITTSNKKKLIVTEDHLFPVFGGVDKRVDELTQSDNILFNTSTLDAFPERDEKLSYNDGLVIGMYLSDGSRYKRKNCNSVSVTLSMNEEKVKEALHHVDDVWTECAQKNNVISLNTCNKEVYDSTIRWVDGSTSDTKRLNLDCLMQSKEFRQGIVDSHYLTYGGNSNRIYTTSVGLKSDMEALFTSLGYVTACDEDDRRGEVRKFRDEKEFTSNHVVYCVRWHEPRNKRSICGIYTKLNGQTFYSIDNIKELEDYEEDMVYCLEMKNKQEPYFTLPNGVVTHNCRLRNELVDNTFSYSLGAGGVATGSKNVITINMNRLIQEGHDLEEVIKRVHMYQVGFDKHFREWQKNGLLPAFDANFITLDKQFLTLGVNGIVEAAEYLGYEINNNQEYIGWVQEVLGTFKKLNKEAKKEFGLMFNTEVVPRMSGHTAV